MPEMPPAVVQFLTANWASQALIAVVALGVPDALADGPLPLDSLAERTGANPAALARLLRSLSGQNLFRTSVSGASENTVTTVALAPAGDLLRRDVPGSVRDLILLCAEDWHQRAWGHLTEAVRSGRPAIRQAVGTDLFSYFATAPAADRAFHRAMGALTALVAGAVVQGYDFAGIRTLVDVGGGEGRLLLAILAAHPQMTGVICDRASAGPAAATAIAAARAASRCTFAVGDFFTQIPSANACLLKNVLHDWDDTHAAAILATCRRALPADGQLIIVEAIIPPGDQPGLGRLLDLEMLVLTDGGRERSAEEFTQLLARAGFAPLRIIATASPMSVIVARPA